MKNHYFKNKPLSRAIKSRLINEVSKITGHKMWNIAYANGLYVVVGDDGYILTSTDTRTKVQIKYKLFNGERSARITAQLKHK